MKARIGLLEHFRKLASFRGREDRASFWPYAALVLGIVMLAGALMSLPMMAWLIQNSPQFTAPEPGEVTFSPELGELSISAQGPVGGPPLPAGFLTAYLAVTLGLTVLLYAAAVARRLHDRGKSGAWGLIPLPFLIFTSVQTARLFGSVTRGEQPDMDLFFAIAVSNILFWAALLALVVLLAGASDPERNAYDPKDEVPAL